MDCSLPGEVHGIFPWQEYWSGVLLPSPVLGVRTPIYHLGDITQCNSQNPGRQKQEKIFPLGIASESVLCHGITQGSPEKQTIRYILAKTFISTDPWTWVLLVLGLLNSDWDLHRHTTCPPPPCKLSALGLGLNYTTSFSGSFRLKMEDYGTSQLHNQVSQFLLYLRASLVGKPMYQFSSVHFSHSVVSDSL